MTLLALKYRPERFADLYGQVAVRTILQSFVHSGDCPPAFLFTGPSGTGKTSAARILAAALNCSNPSNGDCCAVCDSCLAIRKGSSSTVHEVDAASSGGIDSIRDLKNLAQFSVSGNWRVILLDEAHAMSSQAFNALLKVLEEPPSQTVFVLLTTEPNKILPTVRSRAMPIDFKMLSPNAIFERLKIVSSKEGFKFSEPDLKELSSNCNGSMRDALMILDQSSKSKMPLSSLIGKSSAPQHIVKSLLNQDLDHARSLLVDYFDKNSDISQLITGIIDSVYSTYEAQLITRVQLIQSMQLLWETRNLNPSSRSTRAQMEAMLVILYSLFMRVESKPEPKKSILPIVEQPSTPAKEEISSMEELISLTEE